MYRIRLTYDFGDFKINELTLAGSLHARLY